MPLNDERTKEYKPKYLYIEDYPLTADEIDRLKTKKEEKDDDNRGIIIIEIL